MTAVVTSTFKALPTGILSENSKSLPVFPKANSLLFNSGNVVSSNRLKKKTNQPPEEELIEVFSKTLESWLRLNDHSQIKESKVIECRHPEFCEKINPANKDDVSISVKLFLNTFDVAVLNESIKTVLEEIGVDQIDTLIISLSDKIFTYDELPKEIILPLWSAVQNNIQNKSVTTAGLSDFNAKYLEQLINSLEDKNHAPALNQVNLASCCKMPEDLVEYAKINNVQLTTHNDPREILTVDNLQNTIKLHTHDYDGTGWVHSWVARYTLILKGRGILKSKGYIINAQREIKYTK